MRDVLAVIVIFIIIIVSSIVFSDKPPTGALDKTICANVKCYYEIKGK